MGGDCSLAAYDGLVIEIEGRTTCSPMLQLQRANSDEGPILLTCSSRYADVNHNREHHIYRFPQAVQEGMAGSFARLVVVPPPEKIRVTRLVTMFASPEQVATTLTSIRRNNFRPSVFTAHGGE